MKKPSNSKKSPIKKSSDKAKDSGELRKPSKLAPQKEKDKKNWKSNLDDEEEDFTVDENVKLDSDFDEEDEEEFFDEEF